MLDILNNFISNYKFNYSHLLILFYLLFKLYSFITQKEIKEDQGPLKLIKLEEFQSLLKDNKDKIIIIDFYALWCGPCKVAAPLYTKLSEEEQYSNVIFRKCNVDESKEIAKACNVKMMPTFKIFYGEKEIETIVGYNENKIREIIKNTTKSK